jgi:hypothetical protein
LKSSLRKQLCRLIAFSVVAIVAFITGNLPWNYFAERVSLQAQIGGLSVFLLSAMVFLSANLLNDLRWLQTLTWVFLAIGAHIIAGRLIPRWVNSQLRGCKTARPEFVWILARRARFGTMSL